MRLTQHADYALRTLIFLGLLPPEQLTTIQEIAETYKISRNHLMKVVGKLAANGYVSSSRGAGGGIKLAKPPESISIGHVVRDMEPDDGLVECLRPDNQCVITPACVLPNILAKARAAFMAELNTYTLLDLLPRNKRKDLINLLAVELHL
jgi:Rrf2 family nitric oxide-sensitive transcriptional repressor